MLSSRKKESWTQGRYSEANLGAKRLGYQDVSMNACNDLHHREWLQY